MPLEIQQLEDELTAALSIEDERTRAEKLIELAPALPDHLLDRLLVATNALVDYSLRGSTLAAVAPYLKGEQLNKAVTFAVRIPNLIPRNFALGALGPLLPEAERNNVIATVKSSSTASDRLKGWMGLYPYLTSDLKNEAISTALSLSRDSERAEALIALAPHLTDTWKKKALESAKKIPDPILRIATLAALIPALPKRERANALEEALTLARGLTNPHEQALAFIRLLPLVPAALRDDLVIETYALASQTSDKRVQAELMVQLAALQSSEDRAITLERALFTSTEIDDETMRGEALLILARSGFNEIQTRILQAAKKIKDPKVKSRLIIQLQSLIEQEEAATPPSSPPPEVPEPSLEQPPDLPAGIDAEEPESFAEPVGRGYVSQDPKPPGEPPLDQIKSNKAKAPRKKPPKVEAPVIDEHEPLSADDSVNTKTYLHSDRWTLDDQLNYSIYAGAIAEFILHPDTKPPLAIGILAPWGQGKTTLMKLIQNQLQLKAKQEPVTTTGMVAPPLSTSVTFAYLSKWLQDPKYELAAPKLEYPTVWFNAWKYQNSEQLWAGMAYSILSQLVGQIGNQAEREKFWLALQAERVDFNAIRQDIHRMVFEGVAPWIGISIILAIIGVVVIVVGYFAGSGIWGAGSGGVVMLAGVLLPAIKWLVARAKIKSKPLEGKFARYVRQPTYEGKLGFFHEIETDVQRVFRLLIAEGKPVVVFIDDLDRCSPGTVAQVIEAMNLFLSADFPDCYFVVGMDAQVVAASMEVAYEDLNKKMKTVTRSYGSLGWYFMDKFIQLQFSIPNMTPDQRGIYLTKLFGQEVNKKQVIPEAELDNIEKNIEESLNSPAVKAEQLSQQAEQVAKFRLQRPTVHQRLSNKIVTVSAQKLSDDNPSLQRHIERYEPFLGVSPRGIKRFSNLYRFYNLSQITRRTQGLPSCSQSALARWLVIMLRWPQLVRWIQWEGEAKISAGASALNKAEAFEEQLVKTETHSAWVKYLTDLDKDYAEWMGDKQLYEFLKTTARPSEKLSLAVETGVW